MNNLNNWPPTDSVDGLKKFCSIFSKFGFKTITAEYNGYADSGNIENISFFDKDDNEVNGYQKINELQNHLLSSFVKMPKNLNVYLESFIWDNLPPGCEINSGGQGTLKIDLDQQKLHLDHSYNMEYDPDEDGEF